MPLDPLERAHRLVPIAVAAFALAIAVAPALIAGAAPGPRAWLAPGVLALAAGLTSHVIAAARPGWSGVLGGAVAGVWLAAAPPARTAAALAGADALALAATAGLLTAGERLARVGAARPTDRGLVAAALAIVAVVADLRAWPLAVIAAALLARRAERRARWLALGPALVGLTIGVIVVVATLGHGPAWAAPPAQADAATWLADAVDRLGPIAIIAGALGLGALIRERRDRWLAAMTGAALATLLPPTTSLAAPGLIAWALALGVAADDVAARVGRPAHQALTAVALTVVLAAPFALL